jgi:hypothetical protein
MRLVSNLAILTESSWRRKLVGVSMDSLDQILGRPKAYYNVDGVGELGIGFMCGAYSVLGWMQLTTPERSFWHRMDVFFVYVAVMVGIIHYGSKAIKERITYPRTGRVEYSRRDRVWTPMFLGAAVSVLCSVVVVLGRRSHWDLERMSPLIGLLMAGTYAYGLRRDARWKPAVAAAIGVFSIALVLMGVGGRRGFLLALAAYGVLASISGGISFWVYLRQTR